MWLKKTLNELQSAGHASPDIGTLLIDTGSLSYIDEVQDADIDAQFSIAAESARDLPLEFTAT